MWDMAISKDSFRPDRRASERMRQGSKPSPTGDRKVTTRDTRRRNTR